MFYNIILQNHISVLFQLIIKQYLLNKTLKKLQRNENSFLYFILIAEHIDQ